MQVVIVYACCIHNFICARDREHVDTDIDDAEEEVEQTYVDAMVVEEDFNVAMISTKDAASHLSHTRIGRRRSGRGLSTTWRNECGKIICILITIIDLYIIVM